ncbi:lysozyme inhibitor LprI family protein [Paraburkholderia oxyphila]|uniref:hypothetical protein n=1 Tax=Paraburkholderia oxyphila TaxID=614212 RepID=UPI0004849315|nr:hypothetical protein [Paraburkholderia oxyphila]
MSEGDGTYGYESALSEDDVRAGRAVKALEMMRYVGNRNGTYVILLLGTDASDASTAIRVSCQAPCDFAKSETMVGGVVGKTETIRVSPDTVVGAMLADAIFGQLKPYGQAANSGMPQAQYMPPTVPNAPPAGTMPAVAPQAQSTGGDGPLQQASFDCNQPGSLPQYLICHDPELASSDRALADLVQLARGAVQDQTGFADRLKKQWNYREQKCKDKPCLAAWYVYEKDIMQKIAQTGDVNAK